MKWLRFGHVCRDIRTALLGMRALWADVVFDVKYERAHAELLRRAKNYPISIRLGDQASPNHIESALGSLSKARVIDARWHICNLSSTHCDEDHTKH